MPNFVNLECQQCKTEFQAPFNKRNIRKYCSYECSHKSFSKQVERVCLTCNKTFSFPESRLKRKSPVSYCSKDCVDAKGRITVSCLTCKKEFQTTRYVHENRNKNFCSKKCFGIANQSSNNYLWKGDKAGYRTKHNWVARHYGKADHCIYCGLNMVPFGKKRYFDWANISGEYKRDISDWIQLCKLCHKAFDGHKILHELRS